MNNVTQEIHGPCSENAITRERRFAYRDAGRISMCVSRESATKHMVTWNANRGNGWLKGWRASFKTAEAAEVFADSKWSYMVGWLGTVELATGRTASDVFSASLAGMVR